MKSKKVFLLGMENKNLFFEEFLENVSDRILIFILFFLCLTLRFIMLYHTYGINNDGIIYTYVAQKIWEVNFKEIFSCGAGLGIVYSFTITLFYFFLKNWELSGSLASIFYSSFSSLPLYKILRQTFSKYYSFFLTFVALNLPYIIKQSVDIIRDTAYWFFLVCGIYFFLKYFKKSSNFYILLFIFSFMLAILNRIEGIIIIIFSLFYLLLKQKKYLNFSFYLFLFLLSIIAIMYYVSPIFFYIGNKVNFKNIVDNYNYYLINLTKLYETTNRFYWIYLRMLLPYVPVLISGLFIIKIYGIFSPFLIYGIYVYVKKRFQYIQIKYLFVLFFIYLLLLIIWSYTYAYLSKRYFLPLIFIGIPFVGLGIKEFIEKNPAFIKKSIFFLIWGILIISILVTISSSRRRDEIIYKKIAFVINEIENQHKNPIIIAGFNEEIKKINFYVNLERKPAICAINAPILKSISESCSNVNYVALIEKEYKMHYEDLKKVKLEEIFKINEWTLFKCQK